ncbi:hypothetical protein X735_15180 [Mesorhizobium sp. L2C085B000]|uniref:KTSC domain-containing protein n=1 Tax=unclassified Mesorhizobium TaxID=325217 RepID=UPI0003CFE399|nr:KTSC domain-containing protein [Mesorhizobium sp. L2C085B000]ESZ14937.1 hypothetical protein X735_15180 [Mesorhizobium sp. L2C085B000]
MPSTSIRKFDYDPNTRVLSVWFVAKHYEFLDVPPEQIVAFRSAFAKGLYFNSRIRNHYAFRLAPRGQQAHRAIDTISNPKRPALTIDAAIA